MQSYLGCEVTFDLVGIFITMDSHPYEGDKFYILELWL